MNKKEVKLKIIKYKIKTKISNIKSWLYLHKIFIIVLIIPIFCILIILLLDLVFNNTNNSSGVINYVCDILISIIAGTMTGIIFYALTNTVLKRKKKKSIKLGYINEIEAQVFKLYLILEFVANNNITKIDYSKYTSKIGTWIVDFTRIRSIAFYKQNKHEYKDFINVLEYKYSEIYKAYSKISNFKEMNNFCNKYKDIVMEWLDRITNYKEELRKEIEIMDKSIFYN